MLAKWIKLDLLKPFEFKPLALVKSKTSLMDIAGYWLPAGHSWYGILVRKLHSSKHYFTLSDIKFYKNLSDKKRFHCCYYHVSSTFSSEVVLEVGNQVLTVCFWFSYPFTPLSGWQAEGIKYKIYFVKTGSFHRILPHKYLHEIYTIFVLLCQLWSCYCLRIK